MRLSLRAPKVLFVTLGALVTISWVSALPAGADSRSEFAVKNSTFTDNPLIDRLQKAHLENVRLKTKINALENQPGELIVRFKSKVRTASVKGILQGQNIRSAKPLGAANLHLIKLSSAQTQISDTKTLNAIAKKIEQNPNVLYAEPNRLVKLHSVGNGDPNDPAFGQQWGLENTGQPINDIAVNLNFPIFPPRADYVSVSGKPGADISVEEAWAQLDNPTPATVAVIDTGVDTSHPDLADNLVPGINAANYGEEITDFVGHGTHVAGIIGAIGDNELGVTGINPRAKVMPVQVLRIEEFEMEDGTKVKLPVGIYLEDLILGYALAGSNGAKVANVSLGSPVRSQAEADTIGAFPNTLFVVAAGNTATNNDDFWEDYPCDYTSDNIICVGASDQNDQLVRRKFLIPPYGFVSAWGSNYGKKSVDLLAPGVNIVSTFNCFDWIPGDDICQQWFGEDNWHGYAYLEGTSMAAPHVAGAAALLRSAYPKASAGEIKAALLNGVDTVAGVDNGTLSGGRLNVAKSLSLLGATPALDLRKVDPAKPDSSSDQPKNDQPDQQPTPRVVENLIGLPPVAEQAAPAFQVKKN